VKIKVASVKGRQTILQITNNIFFRKKVKYMADDPRKNKPSTSDAHGTSNGSPADSNMAGQGTESSTS
jgi:hypothetical protein